MKECPLLISDAFIEWLKARHPVTKVVPGVDRDGLMFNAGCQEVITTLINEQTKQTKQRNP